MAYGGFKDLDRSAADDKVICDKALNTSKNPKYDDYQRELGSMVYRFFDKKVQLEKLKMKLCVIKNQLRITQTNY